MKMTLEATITLFDDASTQEKLTVMSKWEAAIDDERNDVPTDFEEHISNFMKMGKSYRFQITVEEVENGNV